MPHTMRRNKHTFLGGVRAMMRENCTMLTLLMAGDFEIHNGVGVGDGEDVLGDLFKGGLESLVGSDARVL